MSIATDVSSVSFFNMADLRTRGSILSQCSFTILLDPSELLNRKNRVFPSIGRDRESTCNRTQADIIVVRPIDLASISVSIQRAGSAARAELTSRFVEISRKRSKLLRMVAFEGGTRARSTFSWFELTCTALTLSNPVVRPIRLRRVDFYRSRY